MLKMFVGMIVGSMMTMMLLGGASAAEQVLANTQTFYVDQLSQPETATTMILLVVVSICLGAISLWPAKPVIETQTVIKRLQRHCK